MMESWMQLIAVSMHLVRGILNQDRGHRDDLALVTRLRRDTNYSVLLCHSVEEAPWRPTLLGELNIVKASAVCMRQGMSYITMIYYNDILQ